MKEKIKKSKQISSDTDKFSLNFDMPGMQQASEQAGFYTGFLGT